MVKQLQRVDPVFSIIDQDYSLISWILTPVWCKRRENSRIISLVPPACTWCSWLRLDRFSLLHHRACAILGVIFILSSMCILGKAIHDLATKLLPEVVSIGKCLNLLPGVRFRFIREIWIKASTIWGRLYQQFNTGGKWATFCMYYIITVSWTFKLGQLKVLSTLSGQNPEFRPKVWFIIRFLVEFAAAFNARL